MEIKKSPGADLERWRSTRFLAAVVALLALLLFCLEYSPGGDDDADTLDLRRKPKDDDVIALLDKLPEHTELEAERRRAEKKQKQLEVKVSDRTAPEDRSIDASEVEGKSERDITADSPLPDDEAERKPDPIAMNGQTDLRVVRELPQFPGGAVEMMKWLTRNLRYPPAAKRRRIEGRVVATFIVEKDGRVAELKVSKSANPILDREALRVLGTMPRWRAGVKNNEPCRTMVCVPVVFKL